MAGSEEWYILEGMKATVRPDDVTVQKVERDVDNEQVDWFELEGGSETLGSQESIHTQSLSSDASHLHHTEQLSLHTASNRQEANSPLEPGTHRLNLQESIDGEISESHNNSSSINSFNSKLSISSKLSVNSKLSTDMNDTNSLLREAQHENRSSLKSTIVHDNEALEWHNLTTNSNMQDISRPDPVGFARNDPDSLVKIVSSNASSFIPPQSLYGSASKSNGYEISKTSSSSSSSSLAIAVQNAELVQNNDINRVGDHHKSESESIPELSYTPSLSAHEDFPPIPEASLPALAAPLLERDQNYSSVGSSLTMPSYKEISPKFHSSHHETPVTKLLGPAYKNTQHFLQGLKAAKLSYGSTDNCATSDNLDSSENTQVQSRNEACQAGQSQLYYSTLPAELSDAELAYTEGLAGQDITNHDDLVEQDLASASILADVASQPVICNTSTSSSDHVVDRQRDSQSEGEMLLTDISDPLRNSSRRSVSSKSSFSQVPSQSTSSSTRTNLEPIPEVLSPEFKRIEREVSKNISELTNSESNSMYSAKDGYLDKSPQHQSKIPTPSTSPPHLSMIPTPSSSPQHLSKIPTPSSLTTYRKFKAGRVSSSSTPNNDDSTLQNKQESKSQGIYDIRKSTSPGSTNRKRVLAGKVPKSKSNEKRNPLTVYVSEDSKLTDSLMSTASHGKKDSTTRLHRDAIHNSTLRYSADTRIKEISQKLSQVQPKLPLPNQQHLSTSTTTNGSSTIPMYADQPSTDDTDALVTSNNTFVPDSTSSDDSRTDTSLENTGTYSNNPLPVDNEAPLASHSFSKPSSMKQVSRSYNGRTTFDKSTTLTPKVEKRLDLLWHEFDESMKYESKDSSPILRKLELLSEIIREQKRKRLSQLSSSQSSSGILPSPVNNNVSNVRPIVHADLTPKTSHSKSPIKASSSSSHRKAWSRDTDKKSAVSPLQLDTSSSVDNILNNRVPLDNFLNKRVPETTKRLKLNETGKLPTQPDKKQTYRVNTQRQISSPENFQTYRVVDAFKPQEREQSKTFHEPYVCPFCRKRSVGTNCPTPCSSDVERDAPLKLQTWTQTTPYIPTTNEPVKKRQEQAPVKLPVSAWVAFHKNTEDDFQEENELLKVQSSSKKLSNTSSENVGSLAKPHRTKSINNLLENHEEISNLQDKSNDVAYIAWFHTARSDNSDVIQIEKQPTLQQRYMEHRKVRKEKEDSRSHQRTSDILTLQEAFILHKQTFIYRLKQRVQDVKDTRLTEKHFFRRKPPKQVNVKVTMAQQQHGVAQHKLKLKQEERKPKIIISKDSPRELHRQEEEKLAVMKRNRLKMKQYDSRIREVFLRRQPIRRTMKHYVERHR